MDNQPTWQGGAQTNEFVEVATGLNHLSDETPQQWLPSREEWEVYPDAVVARAGQHKVILAYNLNLAGAVDVLTPDGKRLVSSPASLWFYDPVDGKQVVIAEVKECAPERGAAANEIVFRDCFQGTRGSIRYFYTKAGLLQEIVLEQELELPEGFSDRSRLECYTVFAPETTWPRITTRVLRGERDARLRELMVEPDFTDSELDFGGGMAMRAGTAFSLGEEAEGRTIRVGKQFVEIEGQPVLIEAVEFRQLEPLLARLASVERADTSGLAINSTRQIKRSREQARLPQQHFRAFDQAKEIQLASNPLREPAVVVDYQLLASATNMVLAGDKTWFVSGFVSLSGTTTIEGGCVVKFTNSAWAKIAINGPISCQTGPYRPAIFTVKDDNSVGETVPGSTGNPTNQYASGLLITSLGNTLTNLRFTHLYEGLSFDSDGSSGWLNVGHAQFVKCRYPLNAQQSMCFINCGATIQLDNALITACSVAFRGDIGIFRGRHVTINQCNWLGEDYGNDCALYLTNSLLVAVTNWGNMTYTTHTTVRYATDPGGIFQTVGAGQHYLVNGSTNRNAGTTNINSDLLASLRKKTTYPPVVLSNASFSASTNLAPQAARDTDLPDLGFHYDPLDWLCSQISPGIATLTITLTNGVAVGLYGSHGFSLRENNRFLSEGRPEAMNRIVWYPSVQEQPVKLNNVSIGSSGMFDVNAATSTYTAYTKPILRLRFTELVGLGRRQTFFYPVAYYYGLNTVALTDCWLRGVDFTISGYNWTVTGFPVPVATLQNDLVERGTVSLFNGYFNSAYQCPLTANLYNNLFWSSSLALTYNDYYASAHPNWYAKDNLFDTATNSFTGTGGYTTYVNRSHNGFYTTTNNLGGTANLTLTSLAYSSGPLGNFYLPHFNALNNVGSRSAFTAGLYHYTTKITQAMESNSIVDIGFHYMVVSNGVPFDTDADGTPDYADADSDGNDGLPDSWEQQYFGTLAQGGSDDYDGDCLPNLFEYQQGSNPADQPTVTSAPVYQIVPIGANVTFSVAGSPACVRYQWYKDYATIAGATNTTLTLTSVQLTSNALYKANVLSGAGVTSAAARLVVLDGPAWTIWTNYLAHTNDKSINLWTTYSYPSGTNPPTLVWNTNCLLYGMTNFTAISPLNSFQLGQSPITAITRRHGYAAAHPIVGTNQYDRIFDSHAGAKVWFCTATNKVETMIVDRLYINHANGYDYAIFMFSNDLPATITPMSVMVPPSSIGVNFTVSTQNGWMSANIPPFVFGEPSIPPFNEKYTHNNGDSGSPNMIPMPDGSLVFIGGTTSSEPSIHPMQDDINKLSESRGFTNVYQLTWHNYNP